jgi:hypothetical protein
MMRDYVEMEEGARKLKSAISEHMRAGDEPRLAPSPSGRVHSTCWICGCHSSYMPWPNYQRLSMRHKMPLLSFRDAALLLASTR